MSNLMDKEMVRDLHVIEEDAEVTKTKLIVR